MSIVADNAQRLSQQDMSQVQRSVPLCKKSDTYYANMPMQYGAIFMAVKMIIFR